MAQLTLRLKFFERNGEGELVRSTGLPTRPERFERIGVDVHRILRGEG